MEENAAVARLLDHDGVQVVAGAATAAATLVALAAFAVPASPILRVAAVTLLVVPGLTAGCLALSRTWRLVEARRRRQLGVGVGRALHGLGPAYRLISRGTHPGCGSLREEHVAIGPNGIFVIFACDERGRVTASESRLFVNAKPRWRNLVEDCRIEALRVDARVRRVVGRPLPVHAVLCFTRALVAVGHEVRGMKVVHVPRLARLIASTTARGATLAEADIDAATAALTIAAPVTPLRRLVPFRPRLRAASARPRATASTGASEEGYHGHGA